MRRHSRGAATALLLSACLLCGCQDYMWWEYRDDPYIADQASQGDQEVLRHVNSVNAQEREMALRILATQAGEARRRGNAADADRIEAIIIRRYYAEKDSSVRACVVRICAPSIGRGSGAMVRFLRERIAAGEFPGYAAMSLAALAPREAFADIEPLTRHPAPEVRLQAATALTVLADPRGFEPVARVWRGMEFSLWPDKVEGVPLAEARQSLGLRAHRAFGRPLF